MEIECKEIHHAKGHFKIFWDDETKDVSVQRFGDSNGGKNATYGAAVKSNSKEDAINGALEWIEIGGFF